jgi:hypothetical protein
MSGRHEIIEKRWIFDPATHVDILKIILKNTENKINENRNGIYVNMSLSVSTVDAIEVYLKYVEDQQRTIEIFEKQGRNQNSLVC